MDTTVVVVGAGLAGLTAARELQRAGIDVLVVEAADRPGGRTLSETTALGSRLDLGGQWIGHDHDRVKALAAELGATPFVMHSGVLPEIVEGGKRTRLATPSVIVAGLAIAAVAVLGRIAPRERWTDTAVDAWLSKVPGRRARRLLEASALVSWTTDLDRLSVGGMLSMLRAQGGMKTILSTRGGAQEALLVEGIGTLTERMAADLGSRVRTGRRVTAIDQDASGVTVRIGAGELRAAKAIVTVPPPMARRIVHDPPLPADRAAVERNTEMGTVYKAIAVFERPFWRGHGRTELVVLDNPVCAVFDTSPPDGPGHLCILASGPEARALDDLDPAPAATPCSGHWLRTTELRPPAR